MQKNVRSPKSSTHINDANSVNIPNNLHSSSLLMKRLNSSLHSISCPNIIQGIKYGAYTF